MSQEVQFRDLYEKHHRDIWRYCLRRSATPEEAEEIFNSTFTLAWQNFADVPTDGGVRPWLFTVARNHMRNSQRKSARYYQLKQRLESEPGVGQFQSNPMDMALGDVANVERALRRLREEDQELLMLVAWENLSQAEIGQALGCTENAVAIRLHRARGRLAKQLDQVSRTPEVERSPKGTPTARHVDIEGTTTLGGDA